MFGKLYVSMVASFWRLALTACYVNGIMRSLPDMTVKTSQRIELINRNTTTVTLSLVRDTKNNSY